ncbi:F-box/kelch-repeat protein At3g06240 [Linum grandiflorum]
MAFERKSIASAVATASESNDNGSSTYLTEDILLNILQWLPILSCIARFRCVCRSWRTLLSNPNVIRRIIFSQISDAQKRLKILITGIRVFQEVSPLICSVYSYETLRPITGHKELHVNHIRGGGRYLRVVGCCNGIFCMAQTTRSANGNYIHNMILWNPATSETKIIPPGPRHPCHSSRIAMSLHEERIGFGFDPKTKDYKVVHVLEFEESMRDDDDRYDYDPAEFYHGHFPLIFTEVYSLRNESWKTLNVATHYAESRAYDMTHRTIDLRQQLDTSQNEKSYWFRLGESRRGCAVISFDMSTEVFELATIPYPTGLTHHDEDDVDDPYGFRCHINSRPDDEIWVMFKCGVAESWTKLFTWKQLRIQPYYINYLEVWKDGAYIGARHRDMCLCDIASGKVIGEKIEIEGTIGQFHAHIFTPTQVSMSQLINILE